MAKNLITSRKVVFTPNTAILAALKATGVQITCIDKDGKVVKRVQDDVSNEEIEDGQNGGQQSGGSNSGGNSGNGDNGGGGDPVPGGDE